MPVITFHEGEPAIDVKDNTVWAQHSKLRTAYLELPESVIERIYGEIQEQFWSEASVIAARYDYGGANAQGRSGGWLHVDRVPELEEEDDPHCRSCGHVLLSELTDDALAVLTGDAGRQQCDDCGHIQPSPLAAARNRWMKFVGEIANHEAGARLEFVRAMQREVDLREVSTAVRCDGSMPDLSFTIRVDEREPGSFRAIATLDGETCECWGDSPYEAACDALATVCPSTDPTT